MQLPPKVVKALADFRDMDPAVRSSTVERIRSVGVTPDDSEFERSLKEELSSEQATDLLRLFVFLGSVGRVTDLEPPKLVEEISASIKALPPERKWGSQELKKWQNAAPDLQALLTLENVQVLAKAIDLTYHEYANVLQSVRIITDIRPIFDKSGEKLLTAIISQTLRIHYRTDEGNHSVSISLDQEDIDGLAKSCDRAVKKAKAAKALVEQSGLKAAIAGVTVDA